MNKKPAIDESDKRSSLQRTIEPLVVYAIGSRCIVTPDGSDIIEGLITGVMIEPGSSVSYRCVWWDGRTRREEWLKELEVCLIGEARIQPIGFTGGKGEDSSVPEGSVVDNVWICEDSTCSHVADGEPCKLVGPITDPQLTRECFGL